MRNYWSKQKEEESLEYSARLNSELTLENIKESFDTEEFYKFITNKKNTYQNIYNGVLKAIGCNVEEASLGGALVGKNTEDLELYGSLVKGTFFSYVSKEMNYIPIASFITDDEEDEYNDFWSNKFGLIFFKKKKKYIMVNLSEETASEGEVFDTQDSFKAISDLNTKNKEIVEKFIYKMINNFHFSPKCIYLNKIIKWNLKNLSKNLPKFSGWGFDSNDEFLETGVWLIDYNKNLSKQISNPPHFTKKVEKGP